MKKLLAALCLITVLCCTCAAAEVTLYCAGQEDDFLPRLCRHLAGHIDGADVQRADDVLTAVNLFLAADDSAVYIGDPHAMILSLQGYTDADLRTALLPVSGLAAAPATLYATEGALALCPDKSEESLTAFTESQPFALCIGRLIDASPEDYLLLEATALMYVDQNLYFDYAEAAQAAQDGTPDLYVFGAQVPKELQGLLTPVYQTALSGPFLGAFMHPGAPDAAQTEAALLSLLALDDTQELLKKEGYADNSWQTGEDFAATVKQLFDSYIQYLTNEGLFFYEF